MKESIVRFSQKLVSGWSCLQETNDAIFIMLKLQICKEEEKLMKQRLLNCSHYP